MDDKVDFEKGWITRDDILSSKALTKIIICNFEDFGIDDDGVLFYKRRGFTNTRLRFDVKRKVLESMTVIAWGVGSDYDEAD